MRLIDCKLGDNVKVWLGTDGNLYQDQTYGLSSIRKVKIPATIVCIHPLSHGIMLGWDNTASVIPNGTNQGLVAHTMYGYSFMKDFHKQYIHTIWAYDSLECDVISTTAWHPNTTKKKKYKDDTCPCGIILTLHSCDYHPL